MIIGIEAHSHPGRPHPFARAREVNFTPPLPIWAIQFSLSDGIVVSSSKAHTQDFMELRCT